MRTRSLVLVAAVGLALGGDRYRASSSTSDHLDNKAAFLSLALTVGLSFLVSGVIALWRRPGQPHRHPPRPRRLPLVPRRLDRVGQRLDLHDRRAREQPRAGRVRAPAARVPDRPAPRPQGSLARGRARTRSSSSAAPRQLLVDEQPDSTAPTARARSPSPAATPPTRSSRGLVSVLALALVVGVLAIVVTRFLRAHGALRRALGPVLGTGALVMVVLLVQLIVDTFSEDAAEPLYYVFLVAFALVPVAFLAGVLRSRLARVRRRRPAARARSRGTPLRDALAHALQRSVARPRLLAARSRAARPAGRHPVRRRRRHPRPARREAEREARRRAHPRPLARGRARARRRGCGSGGALARERAAAGRAARAVRLPGDDREHGAVAADVARPRRPDRQLQHRVRAGERLRERRGRALRVLLGRLHLGRASATRSASGSRRIPLIPPPPGRTRSSTGAARRW